MTNAGKAEYHVRLSVADIQSLAAAALAANGFGGNNALAIAGCIADAERDGAASHGLARIPAYVSARASGRIDGNACPSLTERTATHLIVDADRGFAAPAVELARPKIAAMAAREGMVLASFRDSHHLHALWWDVEPLAERGLLALAVVASRPVMAVFGGGIGALGTNPIALSCPRAGTLPLTLDMAAASVARGEIGLAARAATKIPFGWALDAEGRPTDDAEAALAGSQLPFSDSPKAAVLALMIELLAVTLSGGSFGFEAAPEASRDGGPLRTGSAILAFDPSLLSAHRLAHRVDELVRHIMSSGATRLPGDRRHARRAQAACDGVAVDKGLLAEIEALAAK